MVWSKIKRIEKSKYNNNDIIYFDFLGEEKYSIISFLTLKILKRESLNVGDEVFVIKSFSKMHDVIYFVRKVR